MPPSLFYEDFPLCQGQRLEATAYLNLPMPLLDAAHLPIYFSKGLFVDEINNNYTAKPGRITEAAGSFAQTTGFLLWM